MKNEIKTMVNGKKMIINGVEIEEKYWKNQKIVTTWDIGKIHKREPKEINRLFRSNKINLLKIQIILLLTGILFLSAILTLRILYQIIQKKYTYLLK